MWKLDVKVWEGIGKQDSEACHMDRRNRSRGIRESLEAGRIAAS